MSVPDTTDELEQLIDAVFEADRPPTTVIVGDCRTALAGVPSNSIQCCITSPPYFWQRDYGVDGQIGHEPTIQGYVDALVESFIEVRRVLTPTGVLFLNLGDAYYSAKGRPHGADRKHSGRQFARKKLRAIDGPGLGLPRKSLIGVPWRVALALQQEGWTLRSDVIWRCPGRLSEPTARDRPHRTHEHVFILSKAPRYYFDRSALQGEEDVWSILSRPDNPHAHSAPFPVELAERCIKAGSRPGDTVLDPFAGSGTVGVAAAFLRRRSVLIELSPDAAAHAERRVANVEPLLIPCVRSAA